jgi:Skp family chaperone for outer membrane proteins
MKHTALLLSTLFLALGVAAITRAQDDAAAAPTVGAYPVLACDFAYIVERCDEAIDFEEEFRRNRTAAEEKLKGEQSALQIRIKEIQEKTKLSERDEKTYEALKAAITDKGRLEAEIAYRNVTDQDHLQRRMQELLRGAKNLANDVMIARKAHVVLATKVGRIQLQNQKDWQDELLRRRVACHVDGVNITDAVMKMMNEEYARRKAALGDKKGG